MKTTNLLVLSLLSFLVLSGCSMGTMVKNATELSSNSQKECEYKILNTAPEKSYEVVAVIKDLHSGILPISKESKLKEVITPYVCQSGGDAVIAIKQQGSIYFSEMYKEAIIIKFK